MNNDCSIREYNANFLIAAHFFPKGAFSVVVTAHGLTAISRRYPLRWITPCWSAWRGYMGANRPTLKYLPRRGCDFPRLLHRPMSDNSRLFLSKC